MSQAELTIMRAPFDVIIADPPWAYDNPRAIVGNGGRGTEDAYGHVSRIVQADVEAHYPPMTLDEVKSLPMSRVAKRDAILMLWITNPLLAEGAHVEVVKAWGFTPKTKDGSHLGEGEARSVGAVDEDGVLVPVRVRASRLRDAREGASP